MVPLLLIGVVLLVVGLVVWFVLRRDQGEEISTESHGAFAMSYRGYRMDQVDEVLDRLHAQVRANDDELAALRGEVPPVDPPALLEPSLPPTSQLDAAPAAPDAAPLPDTPAAADASPTPEAPAAPAQPRRRYRRIDLLVVAAYLALATYLAWPLLSQAATHYLWLGVQDQQAFEWLYGTTAHNVENLDNLLFSDRQNYPAGVNLMGQASMLGLSLPMLPITELIGAPWTFALIEWLGLALTASGWYWLFARRLGVSQGAAAAGGLIVGFSPAMMSHANGHPNFVAQFLVPVIIDRTLALQEAHGRRAAIRGGLVLGLLVAWQIFIGEEVLLLAAIGMAVAGLVMAVQRRLRVVPMLPGVAIGAAVTLLITAGPLWWQFRGPQSYTEIWHPPAGNDLASLWSMATLSWGSDVTTAGELALNRTEENAFFGIGLWVIVLAGLVALRRRPIVRALGVLIFVTVWLSLGSEIAWKGNVAGIPSLWALVEHLPVVENVLPTRFTLITVPAMAAVVALAMDAIVRLASRGGYAAAGRLAALGALGLALAQIVPTPMSVHERPAVPELFTDGLWRDYVTTGSVLAVPAPWIGDCRALEWQAAAGMDFPLMGGYFVGPNGNPDRGGIYGPPPTPFATWLSTVAERGEVQQPTAHELTEYRHELEGARVDLVVLPPRPEEEILREAVEMVLGPGIETGGVVLWDLDPDSSPVGD